MATNFSSPFHQESVGTMSRVLFLGGGVLVSMREVYHDMKSLFFLDMVRKVRTVLYVLAVIFLYAVYSTFRSYTRNSHTPKCDSCDDASSLEAKSLPLQYHTPSTSIPGPHGLLENRSHDQSSQAHDQNSQAHDENSQAHNYSQAHLSHDIVLNSQAYDLNSQAHGQSHLDNGIKTLSNVVIRNGFSEHHIYTAYYDSRPLIYRPAIVMLGYVRKRSQTTFYCKFTYTDNSTKCIGNLAKNSPLIAPNVMPEMYFCRMSSNDPVPEYVSLSTDKNCDPAKLSSPIPVWNKEKRNPEGVGVCVHGCIYTLDGKSEKVLKDILQFLAMVKVLGAKIVTIYTLNIDQAALEKVTRLYPDFVDIVQWFNLNGTMHYYGQRISINDCIYRNMQRVKYLAMIDLDEMILPVSANRWPDMLASLDSVGKYATYTFSNNFFAVVNDSNQEVGVCQGHFVPKYFVRLRKLPWPPEKQHTKMKMIVKPSLVSATCIHDLCRESVSGYARTYRVPPKQGIMAHYREPVPKWYIYGKGVEDTTALKFRSEVETEMRKQCSFLQKQ